MATLEQRLVAVVQRIRDQFNIIKPRLLPGGGLEGQVLTKNSSEDYDAAWRLPTGGGDGASPGWKVFATGTGALQEITLPESPVAGSLLVFVNGLYEPSAYTLTSNKVTITVSLGDAIEVVKPQGNPGPIGPTAPEAVAVVYEYEYDVLYRITETFAPGHTKTTVFTHTDRVMTSTVETMVEPGKSDVVRTTIYSYNAVGMLIGETVT